jgi:hypothetical protein
VALLAATALGFAFASGSTAANVAVLVTLAERLPEDLLAARRAVVDIDIATPAERRTAADLLARAAGRCRAAASA